MGGLGQAGSVVILIRMGVRWTQGCVLIGMGVWRSKKGTLAGVRGAERIRAGKGWIEEYILMRGGAKKTVRRTVRQKEWTLIRA
jgi:hypothetical protein